MGPLRTPAHKVVEETEGFVVLTIEELEALTNEIDSLRRQVNELILDKEQKKYDY